MFDTLFIFASAQAKKTTYAANLKTAQAICTCVKERRRKVLRSVSRTLTQVQTRLNETSVCVACHVEKEREREASHDHISVDLQQEYFIRTSESGRSLERNATREKDPFS